MEVKRLRTLALEVFKTLMNPEYMKEIFHKAAFTTHRPLNLEVNEKHTTKYGNKSLRCLGTHIWNSLPSQIKKETDYTKFKEFINDWFGMKCKCNFFFFGVSTWVSILNCRYDLGLDPFLAGNGFHYFQFLLNFLIFVSCELYIYILVMVFIIPEWIKF